MALRLKLTGRDRTTTLFSLRGFPRVPSSPRNPYVDLTCFLVPTRRAPGNRVTSSTSTRTSTRVLPTPRQGILVSQRVIEPTYPLSDTRHQGLSLGHPSHPEQVQGDAPSSPRCTDNIHNPQPFWWASCVGRRCRSRQKGLPPRSSCREFSLFSCTCFEESGRLLGRSMETHSR